MSIISRREFVKLAGSGVFALSLPIPGFLHNLKYKPKIGLQLYSIRKEIEKDFEGSVKKIALMGYEGIETYFLPDTITIQQAAKVFKENGLKVFAMHAELPTGNNKEIALRMADAYDSDLVVYHGWPEDDKFKTLDSTDRTVETYNKTASFLKSNGLRFGLHNHWWEFELHDDYYPAYYLLKNLDEEIFFEIDTYWAKTAGLDPVKILHDFGKRATLLHIKDGPAIKGKKSYEQVPAGEGVMDFPSIAKAGGNNIKWMIVEFDEYNKNIFDGVQQSYNYLTKKDLAKGKFRTN
jgi:sugar phosphate isomerase/epimerase